MNPTTGTVTFLLTDIEGSTRLWEEQPDAMRLALARHDEIAAAVIGEHGGALVKSRGEGDSLFAVFGMAADAVAGAAALQAAYIHEPWPESLRLKVRMALHTGDAGFRDGDYYGPPVNRCARLRATGHGGQILLSDVTYDLIRDSLPAGCTVRPLGEHRLKDLERPESIFQLCHPDFPSGFPAIRSHDHRTNNLPIPLTSFVGRSKEVAEVKRLLHDARLVTLTGSGGCGKSRLAVQAGHELLDEYVDGVWIAELAPISDPGLLEQAVAGVLGVHEEHDRPIGTSLVDYLKTKSLLLILDNAEHVLTASAELSDHLLRTCPGLRMLVTSREPLAIAGESTCLVPPLSLPTSNGPFAPESLADSDAAQLFVERAISVKPSFSITNENAAAVASVCCRLDGIPLAIELAAARVRAMTVDQIDTRLDDRFRLLTGGSRTALPRHQTLRALIDWSYGLLTDAERRLLRRLSVFAGGWTLEAAEAVCIDDGIDSRDVLDLLTSLVDRSLVVYEEHDANTRYRLLETIREYAREELDKAGEADRVLQRHLDFYLALAEESHRPMMGAEPGQAVWQGRLEQEVDNLRAALEWSMTKATEDERALRMTGALWWFWLTGHLREGADWTAQALTKGRNAPAWVVSRALQAAGTISFFQGRYDASYRLAEEALAQARDAENTWYAGNAIFLKSIAALRSGRPDEAQAGAGEGMALAAHIGDRWLTGRFLILSGLVEWVRRDFPASRALLSQSLAISRALQDDWHIAMSLANLGCVTLQAGDVAGARALHVEGLPLSVRMGDTRGTAWHLIGMAAVEAQALRPERAAQLLGAVTVGIERLGSRLPPPYQQLFDRVLGETQAMLDQGSFEVSWAAGQGMSLDQAAVYALNET